MLFTGERGFDEWSGEVWGAHLAWSGNHTMLAERLADGRRYLQGGELLHPGEVVIEPGQTYTHAAGDSCVFAAWSEHRNASLSPFAAGAAESSVDPLVPVLLNTWEAIYFQHDTDKLKSLADGRCGSRH